MALPKKWNERGRKNCVISTFTLSTNEKKRLTGCDHIMNDKEKSNKMKSKSFMAV